MSRISVWVARLLLVAFSIAISVLIGELIVARVAPQNLSIWDNTRDGMSVHWIHADVFLPQFEQRILINNIGMRDKERSLEKPPGTVRVLVLGDSFMEALQVPFDESFPALFEKELARMGDPVEVINLSVSGWGTDDQVTYLERYGLALSPDGVLIMMTLHNDVNDNTQLEFHTLQESGLVTRPIELMPLPRFATQKLKAYLSGTSQIYRLAYQTYVRNETRRGAVQLQRHVASLLRRRASPDLERSWAVTLALLDKAAGLATSKGAWLAIGMIPLRVQIDADAFRSLVESHELSLAEMERDAPQRRVAAWALSRGIPLIDLLPAFQARAAQSDELLYLPMDGHWTSAGHRLAAEFATRELVASHVLRADH